MNFRAVPLIALAGFSLEGCPITRVDTPIASPGGIHLAAGDLDGDGREDLVAGHRAEAAPGSDERYGASALLSLGDGTFTRRLLPIAHFNVRRVLLEDFNGDRHLDLAALYVAADGLGDVLVLLGRGDGSFEPPVRVPGPDAPRHMAAADLDGDGHLDLLALSADPPGLYTVFGHGDGTFAAPRLYRDLSGLALAAGDVDGDGAADAVRIPLDGITLDVLLNDGAGELRLATSTPLGVRTEALVLVDIDQDGALDAVTVSQGAGSVRVLRGRGDSRFSPPLDYPVAAPPVALAVARLDRDRWLDVATVSSDDSSVSVLFGLPGGRLRRGPQRVPAGEGAASIALPDVNGDGRPEIATGNATAGSVSVLLGLGPG